MVKKLRLKAVMVGMAAVGGLLTFAPSASAAGNCNNYGEPGVIQFFTGPNYTGNCYQVFAAYGTGVEDNFANVPGGMNDNISSLRSWADSSQYRVGWLYADPYESGSVFEFKGGEWWPTLPSWIDNKASSFSVGW
ncbi:hypothetical protein ACIRRH_40815 [Kitasatospora sp. NPDC101235]|uniref:hypothetical protein n=1 Tax=Kitasatospora sp. NPDC101235 TaxID=3364101 RepID=UPI0038126071